MLPNTCMRARPMPPASYSTAWPHMRHAAAADARGRDVSGVLVLQPYPTSTPPLGPLDITARSPAKEGGALGLWAAALLCALRQDGRAPDPHRLVRQPQTPNPGRPRRRSCLHVQRGRGAARAGAPSAAPNTCALLALSSAWYRMGGWDSRVPLLRACCGPVCLNVHIVIELCRAMDTSAACSSSLCGRCAGPAPQTLSSSTVCWGRV